jgi:hypothetical protein
MAGAGSRRVRWLAAAAVLAAAGVLVAIGVHNGGFFRTGDAWAGRGKPVTFANEPAPPRPDDSFVEGIGGLTAALDARVLAAGGLIRPVSSGCDTELIEPSFTCHVTYLGKVVTYRVTTTGAGSGSYNWQARPDMLVATRGGIEAAVWRAYASQATAMSCDAAIPQVQMVRPQTTLSQRCYFKPTASNPNWGSGSENGDKTVAVQITLYDSVIKLYVLTQ